MTSAFAFASASAFASGSGSGFMPSETGEVESMGEYFVRLFHSYPASLNGGK
jgi:hypothetical protein